MTGKREDDVSVARKSLKRKADADDAAILIPDIDDRSDYLQSSLSTLFDDLTFKYCNTCKESWPDMKLKSETLCSKCFKDPIKFSASNDMDPGSMPDELKQLNDTEEQLIGRVKVVCSVYKLKGGGQYGYSGSVINFQQDTSQLARKLPTHPSKSLTIVVAKGTNKDRFKVSALKIRSALVWLKTNNTYYQDIEIDDDVLQQIDAVGGNIGDMLPQIDLDINTAQDDYIHESAVTTRLNVRQEMMIQSAITNKIEIEQPVLGTIPINEYTTSGYIAMAFPTLFPSGRADLRDVSQRRVKVSPFEYFEHLMKYYDGRFAQHSRFRFFAMNSSQRWQAASQGKVLVNKAKLGNLTVVQLKQRLIEQPGLIKQMGFYNANLRTSHSFWQKRCGELVDMVTTLGTPTVFFTLSAADTQWPELFDYLAPGVDQTTLTSTQRYELIRKNPMIVDWFFYKRAEHYVKTVLKGKYKIKDFWYRVEYQHRGSIHLHGILWLEEAPDVTDLDSKTPEQHQIIVDYFDALSTENHPDVNARCPPVHPCRKRNKDIVGSHQDYVELASSVEVHSTCGVHCMRKPKGGGKERCRYRFPKDLQENSKLVKVDGDWQLLQKRNHPRINRHNRFILQTWRANIDFTPIVSPKAVVNYIAKYASKSEPRSSTLAEIMDCILAEELNDDDSSLKAVTKLMMKTVGERDHSAQECCHLLMQLPFWSSSRDFVNLTVNAINDDMVLFNQNEKGMIENGQSLLEKYRTRPDQHKDKTLYEFTAKHYVTKTGCHTRRREAIVRIFPKLKLSVQSGDCNEAYYRQHVLLHSSHDLPWISEFEFKCSLTWHQMFLKLNIRLNSEMEIKPEPEEFEDEDGEIYVDVPDPFMLLARIGPKGLVNEVDLGLRSMDLENDWTSTYATYESPETFQSFLTRSKQDQDMEISEIKFPNVSFTPEQEEVLSTLESQIAGLSDQKCILVQGKAGTGKSTLIQAIVATLSANLHFGPSSYKLLAPTGAASVNINGQTIHSVLKISGNTNDLDGAALTSLQADFENVEVIIIDEFSMVGATLMGQLERRCKQAKGNKEPFGGLIVYLFGDIKQLPPVKDRTMYAKRKPGKYSSSLQDQGQYAFRRLFSKVHILKYTHRQLGTNKKDEEFRDALDRLSFGRSNDSDWKLFMSRSTSCVPAHEQIQFKDALHIFTTKQEVLDFNTHKLRTLDLPVARIVAKHNCQAANRATTDEALGLSHTIKLSVGAAVILTRNLWTTKKLVNGSRGTVSDLVYRPGANAQIDQPIAIMIRFPGYTGPTINGAIPIAPIQSGYSVGGQNCTRSQFPIKLAYAITAHASQGQTLDRAVIDLGNREFSAGLSYVIMSRIRSLCGLMIQPFPLTRISNIYQSAAMKDRAEAENRIVKLANKK